ncbi:hypothetical protein HZC32_02195, partial [Candidatus Woesearchaeota archaeon]|nr:hypothetical protein [Candidatus Woesearchaeota archaeon]
INADSGAKFSSAFVPPQTGTYTLLAACDGEKAVKKDFCVGPTCVIPTTTPPPGPIGGGYTGGCVSQWDCSSWSFCNVSLRQVRTCTDNRSCSSPKIEEQNCSKCQESWICSLWSECDSGQQFRTCVDEHYCGTLVFKPALSKSCQEAYVAGPQPASVSPKLPPPIAQTKQPAAKLATKASLWDDYKWYFIGLLAFIVLVVIGVVLYVFVIHPRRKVYNLADLEEWMRKERQMGTSDAQIRQILSQNTGWTEDEIAQAFSSLRPQFSGQ